MIVICFSWRVFLYLFRIHVIKRKVKKTTPVTLCRILFGVIVMRFPPINPPKNVAITEPMRYVLGICPEERKFRIPEIDQPKRPIWYVALVICAGIPMSIINPTDKEDVQPLTNVPRYADSKPIQHIRKTLMYSISI